MEKRERLGITLNMLLILLPCLLRSKQCMHLKILCMGTCMSFAPNVYTYVITCLHPGWKKFPKRDWILSYHSSHIAIAKLSIQGLLAYNAGVSYDCDPFEANFSVVNTSFLNVVTLCSSSR